LQLPLVVLLEQQCAHQTRYSGLVREDAHDIGAAFDLGVEPLCGFVTGMIIADAFWPGRCKRRKVRPSGTGASGSTSSVGRPIHSMS
jgi:hypothetical protein